jgi:CTP synthase
VLCEIGGTVGDIEALPFIEAIRQLGKDLPRGSASMHLTLMPWIPAAGELKTKPTQHSVKELRSIGIAAGPAGAAPTGRSRRRAAQDSLFCNVRPSAVIQALDVKSIYEVPLAYHKEGLDMKSSPRSASKGAGAALDMPGKRSSAASQSGRRGHHRRRRQVHRPAGRLQDR